MKLVFAHFETKLPRHLKVNLDRVASLFPDQELVLITDLKKLRPISGVKLQKYSNSDARNILELSLNHPMEFRRKFWLTTLLRLVAVAEYVKAQDEPVLHIESDVLIAEDFPIEAFELLNTEVAFPLVSPGLGVASTFFIRDKKAAENFLDFIYGAVKVNPNTTDMKILFEYASNHADRVTVLPTTPMNPEAFQNPTSEVSIETLTGNLDFFGGIFDTVDMGFFLLGEDARNHRGIRKLRTLDPLSFVNLRYLDFIFSETRNFLNVNEGFSGKIYPVYSLHVHSKDLAAFRLSTSSNTLRKAVQSQNLPSSRTLRPIIFVRLASKFILKRLRLL